MKRIELQEYWIGLGDVWAAWNAFLQERAYPQVVVLVDANTKVDCLPIWEAQTNFREYWKIEVGAGEQYKTLESCQLIWEQLLAANIGRGALLVNLGGGVIGDMGGFCASTYKRGIDFVQFPTTLLSQVDASIGGKLGIDVGQVKNSVGLFRNPQAVFIAPQFLETLPERELRSGLAEILKHGLIADAAYWTQVSAVTDWNSLDWEQFIEPSLDIKRRIVEEDPLEHGIRKALNFGHTVGHAVESWFLETDTPLLHGEAIAIGMIAEAYLSHRMVSLPKEQLNEICAKIGRIYDAVDLSKVDYFQLLEWMKKDKKNAVNTINCSLIPLIGSVKVNQICTEELLLESLDFYCKRVGIGVK